MPGSALMKPSTTRRSRGATEMTRSTRRARSTLMPSDPGATDSPTIAKSKTFHPLVQKRQP